MTQAVLGEAAAAVSRAEAAAAEARRRERFRTARLLTAFNAWVFGANRLHGFTHCYRFRLRPRSASAAGLSVSEQSTRPTSLWMSTAILNRLRPAEERLR